LLLRGGRHYDACGLEEGDKGKANEWLEHPVRLKPFVHVLPTPTWLLLLLLMNALEC